MPDVSLNGIEFEIKGSSDKASDSIDGLVSKLGELANAISKAFNSAAFSGMGAKAKKETEPLSKSLQELIWKADKVEVLKGKLVGLYDALDKAMQAGNAPKAWSIKGQILSTEAALDKFDTTPLTQEMQNLISSASQIDILEHKLESLRASMKAAFESGNIDKAFGFRAQIIQTESALERAKVAAERTAPAIKEIGNAAKKSTSPIAGFVASIKRIAMYRLIRYIIKSVTEAIKEGAQSFYDFTKRVNPAFTNYAKALDGVKAASAQMKNQLGAAFGSLYTAIAPILTNLISLVTKFANVLTMIFAKLSGANGWFKATEASADAIEGVGGAAKEALKYLAPFDELNRLPSDRNGGGGGASGGNGGGYEWIDFEQYDIGQGFADIVSHITDAFNSVSDWFSGINWRSLGQELYDKFSETFENIEWGELAKSVFGLLGSALGASVALVDGVVRGIVADIKGYFQQYITDTNGDGGYGGEEIFDAICHGIIQGFINIGDWIKENVWTPLKTAFTDTLGGETWLSEIGGGFIDTFLSGFQEKWTLAEVWFTDVFLRGIKQMLIDFANDFTDSGLAQVILTPLNFYNEQLGLEPIEFKLIPDLDPPPGTLFEQAKAEMEAKAKKDPIGMDSKANMTGYTRAELKTPEIPTIAKMTQYTRNFASGTTTSSGLTPNIPVRADMTSYARHFASGTTTSSGLTPNIPARAELTSYVRHFASGTTTSSGYTPKIPSQAELTSYVRNFQSGAGTGGKVPELPSKSILQTFKNALGVPSVKSQANLASSVVDKSIADGQGRLKVSTLAKITSVDSSSVGTIQLTAKARVTGYTEEIKANGGVFSGGSWHDISRYAGGGLPLGSQLFWARESGPELVGTLGSHTAVMNNDQIVASVSAGVARAIAGIRFSLTGLGGADGGSFGDDDAMYNAMLRAMNEANAQPLEIDMDGERIYNGMVRRNRSETYRTGVNQMMATA